ncbi:MAG: hypothetical protein V8R16_04550 [Bacilli bacterium]
MSKSKFIWPCFNFFIALVNFFNLSLLFSKYDFTDEKQVYGTIPESFPIDDTMYPFLVASICEAVGSNAVT